MIPLKFEFVGYYGAGSLNMNGAPQQQASFGAGAPAWQYGTWNTLPLLFYNLLMGFEGYNGPMGPTAAPLTVPTNFDQGRPFFGNSSGISHSYSLHLLSNS